MPCWEAVQVVFRTLHKSPRTKEYRVRPVLLRHLLEDMLEVHLPLVSSLHHHSSNDRDIRVHHGQGRKFERKVGGILKNLEILILI